MSLADHIRPWQGDVYRHIPDGSPYAVTDFRFAGTGRDNRWNQPGEPTLYLASDAGLAIAEFARHLQVDYHPDLICGPIRRRLYRLHLQLDAVLDFCDENAWAALGGLTGPPGCFLEKQLTRSIARYVRIATPAVAMRVPSMAFLDNLTRWILVVFLDKPPCDQGSFIQSVTDAGVVHIGS